MIFNLVLLAAAVQATYTAVNSGRGNCGYTSVDADAIADWHVLDKAAAHSPSLPQVTYPNVPVEWKGKRFTRSILADYAEQVLAPVLLQTSTNKVVVNWEGVWEKYNDGWLQCKE
ncbi:hypothetical protein PYCC9005_002815 [Savitreella phatthalungensis]